MSDPHRTDADHPARPVDGQAPRATRSDPLRALLWTVLVLSVGVNAVASSGASSGALPSAVPLVAGLVTAASVAVLVALHLGRR